MSEEVILWNKIGRNFNIQDFQKFCPNFDSLFLWNRSTKNTKSFIIKHYIFWKRTQNSKGSIVKSRYNRIKLIQTSQKIEFTSTVGHILRKMYSKTYSKPYYAMYTHVSLVNQFMISYYIAKYCLWYHISLLECLPNAHNTQSPEKEGCFDTFPCLGRTSIIEAKFEGSL